MTGTLKSLTAVLCGSVIAASVNAADQVLINVDAENPPFMFIREGKVSGVYPAVIVATMKKAGIAVTLEAKPWKRALAEIDEGKAGVGGIYRTAERAQKYDFSDPILTENIAVYFNRSKPIEFKALTDLNGKKVGVIRGWSYGDAFDAARNAGAISVEEVTSDRANLMKLAEGRLDAVLAIEESGKAAIAAAKLGNIDQAKTFLASNRAHLAFAKSAKQTELLGKFNKAIAAMKQDGSLDKIVLQELAK